MSYPQAQCYNNEGVLMCTTKEVSACPRRCNTKNCLLGTTGVLQIIIAIISIIFGFVVLAEEYNTDKTPVAMPIWAGVVYLLTGIFGIFTFFMEPWWLLTTYMSMSLVSCVLATTQVIWESIASTIHRDEYEKCNYPSDGSTFDCFDRLAEYMHIGGAVTAAFEIIAGTFAWTFACYRGGCNCMPPEKVVVVTRPRPRRPPPPRRVNDRVIIIRQ